MDFSGLQEQVLIDGCIERKHDQSRIAYTLLTVTRSEQKLSEVQNLFHNGSSTALPMMLSNS